MRACVRHCSPRALLPPSPPPPIHAPGEHGKTSSGKPYHFKGASFYRIIDRFIDQAGIETDSVFGGMFQDDEGGLKLRHDRKVRSSRVA